MLSRVADALYWMSRYIERAEYLARLVDVNMQSILDLQAGEKESEYWKPLLYTFAEGDLISEARADLDTLDVGYFIALAKENPGSIRQCIALARENARSIRDQLSEGIFVELNSISLFLQSDEAERLWHRAPEELCRRVIRFSLVFQGLCDSTLPRNEGSHFIQMGKNLERADKTSRILDMLTYGDIEMPSVSHANVLRSCSALAAYRYEFRGRVSTDSVALFLLFSSRFPRSVRFCAEAINTSLHAISGHAHGHYSNEVERITGSLQGELSFSGLEAIQQTGLHDYIDRLQSRLNEIGQKLFETYILLPSAVKDVTVSQRERAEFFQYQQQQQQQ